MWDLTDEEQATWSCARESVSDDGKEGRVGGGGIVAERGKKMRFGIYLV